ncbi:unnamed protein product [Hymenolepis diminuta]|uniref:Nop domain-containing protein n=1 Tax=Hymenolepis diminuta TaxID=6216 RepID=A0A0R3SQI2_HYMDI|nr:unnamed protein product [Hymenolepis diminuta]
MFVIVETVARFTLFIIKDRAEFESIQNAAKELENQDFLNLTLLDKLGKKLNNYMMRYKGMYNWHLSELGNILNNSMTLSIKDVQIVQIFCDQILNQRDLPYYHIRRTMVAFAPNLTSLVGGSLREG